MVHTTRSFDAFIFYMTSIDVKKFVMKNNFKIIFFRPHLYYKLFLVFFEQLVNENCA